MPGQINQSRGRAVDQPARDMAHEARSRMERHEAVCEERTKLQTQFEEDMRDRFDRFEATAIAEIQKMQSAYERGQADMSTRHSNAIHSVVETSNKTMEHLSDIVAKAIENIAADVRDFKNSQVVAALELAKDIKRIERKAQDDVAIVSGRLWALVVGALGILAAVTVWLLIEFLKQKGILPL